VSRKQTKLVLAVASTLAAFTILLVGPALSLGPFMPGPVDFELRDTALTVERNLATRARSDLHARQANLVRSGVLQAPKRFNLVGFRWRGTGHASLRVRVRRDGESWSRWIRLPVDSDHGPDPFTKEASSSWTHSDPLWAGEADELQYRITAKHAVRRVHLHFVNSRGTSTPLDRLRSGLRHAVHAVMATVASPFSESAGAQSNLQPEIVTREQWGASACPPRATPQYGEAKLAFIHHTVSANEYAPEDSAAMVLAICRYHRNSNRWNDIGYNFLVDRYGKVFEGRGGGIDQAVIGAQAQGYNSQSTGIASLGTFSTTGQSDEALAALARLLSWKLALHGVPPKGKVTVVSGGGNTNRYPAGTEVAFERISGHRDGDATSCPGDALYAQIPRLRDMVLPDPRPPTSLALSSPRRRIPYGRKARVSGKLTGTDGLPLAGQRVLIQAFGGGAAANALGSVQTDAAGGFALNVRLVFNRILHASFEGSAELRPTHSAPLPVGVRPRLTASLYGAATGRVAAGSQVRVRGSVRPRKRSVLLLVDRQGSDGGFRRVAKTAVRARLGRVRARYRFRKPGRYRVRLGVDRDARNFSARSAAIVVDVS
jgi:N-acetylmuramoyl-L-alanine amidase-like protein